MAVTITSNLSFEPRTTSANITWNVSGGGQNSFEIQYKLKDDPGAWRTSGKITSTNNYYPVKNLYTPINNDFVEIWYRVVVYATNTLNGATTTSIEKSDVKSIMFHNGITGTLRLNKGSISEDYPMFSYIKNTNVGQIKVNVNGIKHVVLVDSNHPNTGTDKVNVGGNIRNKNLLKSTSAFANSGIYSTGQLTAQANYYGKAEKYYSYIYVSGSSERAYYYNAFFVTGYHVYGYRINYSYSRYVIYTGTYYTGNGISAYTVYGVYSYMSGESWSTEPLGYEYNAVGWNYHLSYSTKYDGKYYYTDNINYNYTYYYGNWNT